MRKQFLFIFILAFLFLSLASVSAQPPFQTSNQAVKSILIEVPILETIPANQDFKFHLHPHNSTDGTLIPQGDIDFCLIHLYTPEGGGHLIEKNMTPDGNGIDWEFNVLAGNFSKINMQYAGYMYCQVDPLIEVRGGYFEFGFDVTTTGENLDNSQLYSRLFLIILCILAIVAIQWNRKTINYDKWYSNLAKKYEKRNWTKFALGAVALNLMKNSWIFSYLVGLLGLLILTDLTYIFNITSALEIMKIVLGLYSWSAIGVSLIFFSQVQEWIVGWLDDLQNLNWGIDKQ